MTIGGPRRVGSELLDVDDGAIAIYIQEVRKELEL